MTPARTISHPTKTDIPTPAAVGCAIARTPMTIVTTANPIENPAALLKESPKVCSAIVFLLFVLYIPPRPLPDTRSGRSLDWKPLIYPALDVRNYGLFDEIVEQIVIGARVQF